MLNKRLIKLKTMVLKFVAKLPSFTAERVVPPRVRRATGTAGWLPSIH